MALVELRDVDGTWERLKRGWGDQCQEVGEDFDLYAQGTFAVLNALAGKPEDRAGIYAVQRGDNPADLICQVNCTPLPGHPEPVLRVRMVTVSPAIDFGQTLSSLYVETLAELFTGIVELSQGDIMRCAEFKLHLRSPEDHNFFRATSRLLTQLGQFERVSMHGAWLHVVKGAN